MHNGLTCACAAAILVARRRSVSTLTLGTTPVPGSLRRQEHHSRNAKGGGSKHLVQHRMKRTGSRWSDLGARAILDPYVLQRSVRPSALGGRQKRRTGCRSGLHRSCSNCSRCYLRRRCPVTQVPNHLLSSTRARVQRVVGRRRSAARRSPTAGPASRHRPEHVRGHGAARRALSRGPLRAMCRDQSARRPRGWQPSTSSMPSPKYVTPVQAVVTADNSGLTNGSYETRLAAAGGAIRADRSGRERPLSAFGTGDFLNAMSQTRIKHSFLGWSACSKALPPSPGRVGRGQRTRIMPVALALCDSAGNPAKLNCPLVHG
jgi:hypothetical protein